MKFIALVFLYFSSGFATLSNFGLQVEGTFGWRQDCANWHIPGLIEGSPDIISEVSWNDLKMIQAGARVKVCGLGNLYARGSCDCAKIYQGVCLDSSVWTKETLAEFCPSIHASGRGETYDISAGFGIPTVRLCGFLVAPIAGYAYTQQHLHMFDSKQLIYRDHPELAGKEISGLDNKIHNRWKGPWTGLDLMICFGNFTFEGEWEYHWPHFFGKGDWNLRNDFANSFYDQANGYGTRTNARILYSLFSCLSFGLGVDYWDFQAQNGRSEIALPVHWLGDNGEVLKSYTKWSEFGFKDIRWRSIRVNGVISLSF